MKKMKSKNKLPALKNIENKPTPKPEWTMTTSDGIPSYDTDGDRYNLTAKIRKFNNRQRKKAYENETTNQVNLNKTVVSPSMNTILNPITDKDHLERDYYERLESEKFIFRLIRTRESMLTELRRLVISSDISFWRGQIIDIINAIRTQTLEIVELIYTWKCKYDSILCPFIYDNQNYLIKIASDLNFLDSIDFLTDIFGFEFKYNPLAYPLGGNIITMNHQKFNNLSQSNDINKKVIESSNDITNDQKSVTSPKSPRSINTTTTAATTITGHKTKKNTQDDISIQIDTQSTHNLLHSQQTYLGYPLHTFQTAESIIQHEIDLNSISPEKLQEYYKKKQYREDRAKKVHLGEGRLVKVPVNKSTVTIIKKKKEQQLSSTDDDRRNLSMDNHHKIGDRQISLQMSDDNESDTLNEQLTVDNNNNNNNENNIKYEYNRLISKEVCNSNSDNIDIHPVDSNGKDIHDSYSSSSSYMTGTGTNTGDGIGGVCRKKAKSSYSSSNHNNNSSIGSIGVMKKSNSQPLLKPVVLISTSKIKKGRIKELKEQSDALKCSKESIEDEIQAISYQNEDMTRQLLQLQYGWKEAIRTNKESLVHKLFFQINIVVKSLQELKEKTSELQKQLYYYNTEYIRVTKNYHKAIQEYEESKLKKNNVGNTENCPLLDPKTMNIIMKQNKKFPFMSKYAHLLYTNSSTITNNSVDNNNDNDNDNDATNIPLNSTESSDNTLISISPTNEGGESSVVEHTTSNDCSEKEHVIGDEYKTIQETNESHKSVLIECQVIDSKLANENYLYSQCIDSTNNSSFMKDDNSNIDNNNDDDDDDDDDDASPGKISDLYKHPKNTYEAKYDDHKRDDTAKDILPILSINSCIHIKNNDHLLSMTLQNDSLQTTMMTSVKNDHDTIENRLNSVHDTNIDICNDNVPYDSSDMIKGNQEDSYISSIFHFTVNYTSNSNTTMSNNTTMLKRKLKLFQDRLLSTALSSQLSPDNNADILLDSPILNTKTTITDSNLDENEVILSNRESISSGCLDRTVLKDIMNEQIEKFKYDDDNDIHIDIREMVNSTLYSIISQVEEKEACN